MIGIPQFFQSCDDYGLPKSVSRFVLPLAVTLKADGSAVFIAGGCVFIAQLESVELDIGKICLIV